MDVGTEWQTDKVCAKKGAPLPCSVALTFSILEPNYTLKEVKILLGLDVQNEVVYVSVLIFFWRCTKM